MLPHHAVIKIATDAEAALGSYKQELGSTAEVIPYTVDALTIDDVRRIIALAYQTPGAYAVRVIAILARSINREAGHALLKVLEEPPVTTQFLIILPSPAGLLPTIRSRVLLVDEDSGSGAYQPIFRQFMAGQYKDRLELIADIAKRKADADYDSLYDGLILYGLVAKTHSDRQLIDESQRQLRQKGAGKKMIWEHIALSLPIAPEL